MNKDHTVTFQIAPNTCFLDPSSVRNINIWLKLSEDEQTIIDVSGHADYRSNILNEKVTKDWKKAKEPRFELPYKTIF